MADYYNTGAALRVILHEVGPEVIARLHRTNPLYDFVWVICTWALFICFGILLGSLAVGPPWFALLILQGAVLQNMALVGHEIFVHPKVRNHKFAYLVGFTNLTLILLIPTKFKIYHLEHHKYAGVDETEAYKFDLDVRWKRFFFMTIVGLMLTLKGRLKSADKPARDCFKPPKLRASSETKRKIRVERILGRCFRLAVILSAVLSPRYVILGYLLPLFVVLPFYNFLRVLLEHAEADIDSLFHCGTYYRCGLFTQAVFLWEAGDFHILHHLYPQMPWYRTRQAMKVLRPIFRRQGMREHRSLARLIYGYLIKNRTYLTLWDEPAHASATLSGPADR